MAPFSASGFAMTVRACCAGVLVACLAGCAAVPARSPDGKPALPTRVVPLPLGTTYTGGEVLHRVLPGYPAVARRQCPALQVVEAVAYVDTAGAVEQVIGAAIDDGGFLPPYGTFYAAVQPALRQWRFAPLHVARWAADAGGNPHTVDGGRRPFTRRLEFHFTCDHGTTRVTVAAVGDAVPR